MDGELKGVKGWLLFFVIIMTAISPVAVIILMLRDLYGNPLIATAYGDLWPSIELFEWAHTAVLILACWFVAFRLVFVQNWTSVKITLVGIWLIAVGGVLAEVGGISIITGVPMGALLAAGIGPELFRPLIFCGIWTAYFLKSERVRNTYRGVEEEVEIFE